MSQPNVEFVVKMVTYSLVIIFKLRDQRITIKKMQIFLSTCHYLRLVRQFLIKRRVHFTEVPEELLPHLVKYHHGGGSLAASADFGNVVIFSTDLLPKSNKSRPQWLLVQTNANTSRWVCAIGLPIRKMGNTCLCSHQLAHNLFNGSSPREAFIFPETLKQYGVLFAKRASIALTSSSRLGDDANEKLKKYFNSTKYMQVNDVVKVDERLSFVVCSVETAQPCSAVGVFVNNTKSSLYQEGSRASLNIPINSKLTRHWKQGGLDSLEDIVGQIIPICPGGLSDHYTRISRVFRPFVTDQNGFKKWDSQALPTILPPSFLMSGPAGSGKRTIARCVAESLGLHFIETSCLSLLGESSKATELRIRNVFQNARQISPAVLYLTEIEAVGKSREGNTPDFRILRFFVSECRSFLGTTQCTSPPVLVIGSCRDDTKCSPDVYAALLHKISVGCLDNSQRTAALEWILQESDVSVAQPIDSLVRKMPGFRFGDLNAAVSIASRHASSQRQPPAASSSNNLVIPSVSMNHAVDLVHEWQSKSMNAPKIPEVRWEDIGGLETIIRELLDTIQLPLKFPDLVQNGLKRSGILLYGPPGTGKTLLAKAVATECSLHFLSVKGPELLNMYVGQSEENVRNVFQAARQASPCLIFFDELDSLAPNRGRSGDSGGVMDRVVSQLLAELDGINKSAVVFVIGATNRPDLIDPALLRPGRFDKLLFLGVNNSREYQLDVLKAQTRKFKIDADVNLNEIVDQLPTHLTGADLYSLCSNAMLKSVERSIQQITSGYLLSERDRMLTAADFRQAAAELVPSVSAKDLESYRQLERQINKSPFEK